MRSRTYLFNSLAASAAVLALLSATQGGVFELSGVPRMHERPIGDLVDALRQLGCRIDYLGTDGFPPLGIGQPQLKLDAPIKVRGDVSSQFLTALLLALPLVATKEVVIDVVGGDGWQQRLDALRPGGRYATSGAVAGPIVQGDLRTIYLNDLTIFGVTHQPREVFAGLVTLINTARIRPVVSQTYALRDIGQAQADLAAGRHAGKLVLLPQGEDR